MSSTLYSMYKSVSHQMTNLKGGLGKRDTTGEGQKWPLKDAQWCSQVCWAAGLMLVPETRAYPVPFSLTGFIVPLPPRSEKW